MKHRFLLDLSVVYHAVRGVDGQDRPDHSCTDLVRLIGQNCHRIVVSRFLYSAYLIRLRELAATRVPALPPLFFFQQLLFKAEKFSQDVGELPELPEGIVIPREDMEIVQSALISRPVLVTADGELREAIKRHAVLGISVRSPEEALTLAHDS